jgi:hypothetical protein
MFMGITIAELEKSKGKALTPLQAHSRYLPIGGKNPARKLENSVQCTVTRSLHVV